MVAKRYSLLNHMLMFGDFIIYVNLSQILICAIKLFPRKTIVSYLPKI